MRHMISFGKTGPLLTLTGMPRAKSWIDIDDDTVTVQMGWAFRTEFPTSSIRDVTLVGDRKIGSIGVHGWRGKWLVNGSLLGLVSFGIDPATKFKMGGVPLRLDHLTLSVEEPEAFVDDLLAAARPPGA